MPDVLLDIALAGVMARTDSQGLSHAEHEAAVFFAMLNAALTHATVIDERVGPLLERVAMLERQRAEKLARHVVSQSPAEAMGGEPTA